MKIGYLLFALCMVLHTTAQVMEKKGLGQLAGTIQANGIFHPQSLIGMITNPWVMGGVALAAVGLLMWLGALSQFSLSYLFSLGSVTYILVALASWHFLGESIPWTRWAGIALICVGVSALNIKPI